MTAVRACVRSGGPRPSLTLVSATGEVMSLTVPVVSADVLDHAERAAHSGRPEAWEEVAALVCDPEKAANLRTDVLEVAGHRLRRQAERVLAATVPTGEPVPAVMVRELAGLLQTHPEVPKAWQPLSGLAKALHQLGRHRPQTASDLLGLWGQGLLRPSAEGSSLLVRPASTTLAEPLPSWVEPDAGTTQINTTSVLAVLHIDHTTYLQHA